MTGTAVLAQEIARLLVEASSQQRLTLSPAEAAAALGVSRDFFDEQVKPDLRLIRRGRLVLVPVSELVAWVERSASRTLEPLR